MFPPFAFYTKSIVIHQKELFFVATWWRALLCVHDSIFLIKVKDMITPLLVDKRIGFSCHFAASKKWKPLDRPDLSPSAGSP